MLFNILIVLISSIGVSWYVMYQIGMGNGIRNGIRIGKEQILNEDIARIENSRFTDGEYYAVLAKHVPQLLED